MDTGTKKLYGKFEYKSDISTDIKCFFIQYKNWMKNRYCQNETLDFCFKPQDGSVSV